MNQVKFLFQFCIQKYIEGKGSAFKKFSKKILMMRIFCGKSNRVLLGWKRLQLLGRSETW
jgi:hypothetical protein